MVGLTFCHDAPVAGTRRSCSTRFNLLFLFHRTKVNCHSSGYRLITGVLHVQHRNIGRARWRTAPALCLLGYTARDLVPLQLQRLCLQRDVLITTTSNMTQKPPAKKPAQAKEPLGNIENGAISASDKYEKVWMSYLTCSWKIGDDWHIEME